MSSVKSFLAAVSIAVAVGLTGIALDEVSGLASRNAALITQVKAEARAQGILAVKVAEVTKSRNSVTNVSVWCHAVNENRIESKRVIPGWRLRTLDCARLEAATARSSGPVPVPTGVSK